jgi:hypothetical protein
MIYVFIFIWWEAVLRLQIFLRKVWAILFRDGRLQKF